MVMANSLYGYCQSYCQSKRQSCCLRPIVTLAASRLRNIRVVDVREAAVRVAAVRQGTV